MQATQDKTRLVQTLQTLTERLSAPDLTAVEARDLCPRLFRLLESIEVQEAEAMRPYGADRRAAREAEPCLAV
jgi:hypothetical protein